MQNLLCIALAIQVCSATAKGISTCTDETTALDVLEGKDLSGQTHVITGGDSGIGYATALALASKNATVLLGCRDVEGKGRKAVETIINSTGNSRITVEKLDLASFDLVRAFAATVAQKVPHIHTLLCNAGIDHSPASHPMSGDGFDMTFQVNFLGHFLLVEKLMPLLRRSQSRIVHVSSAASFSACSWGGMDATCTDVTELQKNAVKTFHGTNVMHTNSSNYGLTKFLQVFHAAELARREPAITAVSLHPGIVKSGMTDALPRTTIWAWCFGHWLHCPLTADEGAATPAYVATTSDALPNGAYFDLCKPVSSVRSKMVQKVGEDATVAYQEQVFEMAQKWTSKSEATLRTIV
jgi:NAD(P)-dependent dehydrogenase (short-subunit alcohol dehydrogenase family)